MKQRNSVEDGRFLRPGSVRPNKGVRTTNPYWHNGRQEYKISDMEAGHLINTIKKLQAGSTAVKSVFKKGKRHGQYKALVLEAAKRGLCLTTQPQMSVIQNAVQRLRRPRNTVRRRTVDPKTALEVEEVLEFAGDIDPELKDDPEFRTDVEKDVMEDQF